MDEQYEILEENIQNSLTQADELKAKSNQFTKTKQNRPEKKKSKKGKKKWIILGVVGGLLLILGIVLIVTLCVVLL